MKTLVSVFSALLLVLGFSTPASPNTEWSAYQRTLATYSGSTTALSSFQKNQITDAVEKNPLAEKFICTGIRYYDQPMSVNIMVRKRAKEACAYAKQLNPALSTWYQNKPTKARSYAGKVLLTVKSPATPSSSSLVETEPIAFEINPSYTEGKSCQSNFGWQVLGKNKQGNLAYLRCQGGNFRVDKSMFSFDPNKNAPLISENVPAKHKMALSPHAYIFPQTTSETPTTNLSPTSMFSDVEQCKVGSVDTDGSADKTFGFPIPDQRARLKQDFKILVLAVEPSDFETTNSPRDDIADVVDGLSKYYERMATKPISFDWTIPKEYLPLGRSIESFNMGQDIDFPVALTNTVDYAQTVIDLYDSQYDYSKFDAVIIDEPRSVPNTLNAIAVPLVTGNGPVSLTSDEGTIHNVYNSGNDDLRDMANWIHEFGHLLGLPDRNWSSGAAPGFDIMFGWYGSPEMSMWLRWVLGITNDDQYNCVTGTQTSTHWLRPVSWGDGKNNAVVIPVDETTVLVAESRRRQGYDVLLGQESEGVYVYRIDVGAKMYQPDERVIVDSVRPERSTITAGGWSFDSQLKPGESVTSDGWQIKSVESGDFGDVIEVSRIP